HATADCFVVVLDVLIPEGHAAVRRELESNPCDLCASDPRGNQHPEHRKRRNTNARFHVHPTPPHFGFQKDGTEHWIRLSVSSGNSVTTSKRECYIPRYACQARRGRRISVRGKRKGSNKGAGRGTDRREFVSRAA